MFRQKLSTTAVILSFFVMLCASFNLGADQDTPVAAPKPLITQKGQATLRNYLLGRTDAPTAYRKLAKIAKQANIPSAEFFAQQIDEYLKCPATQQLLKRRAPQPAHLARRYPRLRYLADAFGLDMATDQTAGDDNALIPLTLSPSGSVGKGVEGAIACPFACVSFSIGQLPNHGGRRPSHAQLYRKWLSRN